MTEEKNTEILEGGSFIFRGGKLFFSHPDKGKNLEINKGMIIANGTRDLCVVTKKRGILDFTVKKIKDSKRENIVLIPEGDIFWIQFVKPTSDGSKSMILDLGSAQKESKPFMNEMLRRFPSIKAKNYDMYAGTDWSK